MNALPCLILLAVVAALAAGCVGVPAGAADNGDSVTITYTAKDLATGAVLRDNRSATFTVGAGDSGLGVQLEKAIRGHKAGDAFTVTVHSDPSLDYGGLVEVNRTLSPIPRNQTAPRSDFTNYVGEPTLGKTFAAYGIYTGVVTGADNDTVSFDIIASEGQRDPVASVGAILVTHLDGGLLQRQLDPDVGANFTIQPPSPFQPQTPLGLQPGSYKVIGATASKLQYARSSSQSSDLIGKALSYEVAVEQVTPVEQAVPTGGNFGVRSSPQVLGDPTSVLGSPLPSSPTTTN
jgi:FKBP-type peptidyl-prolyl cis-trans isomerase 2